MGYVPVNEGERVSIPNAARKSISHSLARTTIAGSVSPCITSAAACARRSSTITTPANRENSGQWNGTGSRLPVRDADANEDDGDDGLDDEEPDLNLPKLKNDFFVCFVAGAAAAAVVALADDDPVAVGFRFLTFDWSFLEGPSSVNAEPEPVIVSSRSSPNNELVRLPTPPPPSA
jgi:hypothetical protein